MKDGTITSSASYSNALSFRLNKVSKYNLNIYSVISDNERGRVSLNISGSHGVGFSGMDFKGDRANTFTGNIYISGGSFLALSKDAGVTSVRGDIYIKDGAQVGLFKSNQISDSSRIYFSEKTGGSFYLSNQFTETISEKLSAIVVSVARGMVIFGSDDSSYFPHGQKHLYLDDLEIKEGSTLLITDWAEGRDHLLVRRDSEHLEESLKRILFNGYDPNAIHLEGYNDEYWEINGAPEPATYGAGLMLGVLGLVRYRRRLRGLPVSGTFPLRVGRSRRLFYLAAGSLARRPSLHPFTEGLVAVHTHGNQAFGRKEPKLGGGSLLVIFPTSPKRVITLLFPPVAVRQGECLQIWELVSSRSDGANSQIERVEAQPAAPRAVAVSDRFHFASRSLAARQTRRVARLTGTDPRRGGEWGFNPAVFRVRRGTFVGCGE